MGIKAPKEGFKKFPKKEKEKKVFLKTLSQRGNEPPQKPMLRNPLN